MSAEEFKEHQEVLKEIRETVGLIKIVADNPDVYGKDVFVIALRRALSILIPSMVYTEGKADLEGVIRSLEA